MSGRRALALLLIVVLVGAACTVSRTPAGSATAPTPTATAASNVLTSISNTPASTATTSSTGTNAPSSSAAGDLANAIINVANIAKPAVVEITNEQTSVSQLSQAIPVGTGTGFIYDNQGHILTNNHVVEGANQLVVTLPDGRTFKGNDVKVLGTDPLTDLAVLQITGSNLPAIQLGDSSQLQVGQWVVAVGYALGLEGQPTVTNGVVSALGRTVQEPSSNSNPNAQTSAAGPYLFDVIQTNAAINPGNSGGPLTDLNGRVVGINTLVAGQAEPGIQAEGIGFAIGINTAKKVADEIVSTGHATHAYMGIEYVSLTPTVAAQLNVTATQGALIQAVVSGSPAEKAGLQKGDIITQIDGKQLTTDSALAEIVDSHKPGDTVTLTVQRSGQTQSIKITLGTHPAS
ncbi:MAG TPA: trypsin-like peptidase domain-containing protein [Thermomicrobiaceae bacterium]|nr:trypsin-like peptidase domain-containing protein [Thermomicrobiaceae bacterium]